MLPAPTRKAMQNDLPLAAIDLGSNSFRLEIGQHSHGQIQRTEYLKETVRLGNGLDTERQLTPEAMQRGWDCLARFGERIAGFDKKQVRAVATQTLREARNRDEFLARGSELLGFPIDVIAGREEARLIYLGVAHLLPQSNERRLVVDIGGRSTEVILGQAYRSEQVESYRLGSVSWSMNYFPDGQFSAAAFERAEIAAKAVLDEATVNYPRNRWDVAYGSSGTIGAVAHVLTAAGWPDGSITREGLAWLRERLIKAQNVDRLRLEGLKEDRRAVIGGGLSVLSAVLDLLDIREMQAAQGALRQGALYDLLNREQTETDVRSTTVGLLARKFAVDHAQAQRVATVATQLLGQLDLGTVENQRSARKLGWAAQLHEIGCQIGHSSYHRHGAYILDHADAPGFSVAELHRLSQLVLGHRGRLKKLDPAPQDPAFWSQILCLRLAVILCHARRDPVIQDLALTLDPNHHTLRCPAHWTRSFPQSAHLLREEVMAWQKMPWGFSLAMA
jgi:exopolyphosphatase/guanosine-5'-triphosphate,3'-diphosphate pyrophosphatase